MPIITPHYELTAFNWGDIYSSAADKSRFTIIDNQLAFLSDRVGDGRIDGWQVTVENYSTREIAVSYGVGIIDRFSTYTYGTLITEAPLDRISYLYMRRKDNVLGGFSGYSNRASLSYLDTTAPAAPSNLIISSVSSYSLTLSWDANSEADINNYRIYRSLFDITYTLLETTTENNYIDSTVDENTLYFYRVYAVDNSGNVSNLSSVFISTLQDNTIPSNPTYFQVYEGDASLQILWDSSPSGNLKTVGSLMSYKIVLDLLDATGISTGDEIILYSNDAENKLIARDLLNGRSYKVTIYAITKSDVLSTGLSLVRTPRYNQGATEVDSISVTYRQGIVEDIDIVMMIDWVFEADPSSIDVGPGKTPDKYTVTVIENGVKEGEPIYVLGSEASSINLRLLPFRDTLGSIIYEYIKPYTEYTVIVRTVYEEIISNGNVKRTTSPVYQIPLPVSNLEVVKKDNNDILFTWNNTTSPYFSNNVINCKIVYLDDPSQADVIISSDSDIGKATTFIVDSSYFTSSIRYEFSIKVVDLFNNESIVRQIMYSSPDAVVLGRPAVPENQDISLNYGEIRLSWDLTNINEITGYRIYRAVYNVFLRPSDFVRLGTLSSGQVEYSDYVVDTEIIYAYFVTSVNVYGVESLNPIDDSYMSYPLLIGSASTNTSLSTPTNLISVQSGINVYLTWDLSPEFFDGYQIFRSRENDYSFEYVGSAYSSDTSFLDEDALIISGDYYYAIRKFRNEGEIFITESTVIPSSAIILAKITCSTDPLSITGISISIDQTVANELKNLQDLIYSKTQEQIESHKHIFDDFRNVDRRIDLNSDIIVVDWITSDYKKYITNTDIEGATTYILRVNGTVNEDYFVDENGTIQTAKIETAKDGYSPINYQVDLDNGTITFEEKLYSPVSGVSVPYSSVPFVSLQVINIIETQNDLPSSRLENLSAIQVISGKLNNVQLPSISHKGRINEELIPDGISLITVDNFVYLFSNENLSFENNKFGTCITFYDIIEVQDSDNELLAATSNGIMYSENFGTRWTRKFTANVPIFKLFYSTSLGIYFALTNYSVYYLKNDSFSEWEKMGGTESVKVIRDITEDFSGNLYMTTDLGVYKLKRQYAFREFEWEQLPILGARSTEAYGILYDSTLNRLLVSNEIGILESYNGGQSWNFTSEFSEQKKVRSFVQSNDFIFALVDDEIWREAPNENFIKISDLPSSRSLKMTIYNGIIFVTSDVGLISSRDYSNIYTDLSIDISLSFSEMNRNGFSPPVYAIREIDSVLFIGTERRLYFYDEDKLLMQYDEVNSVVPSFYVDNNIQEIGIYYNNYEENVVSFDEKQNYSSQVSVVNKYDIYKCKYNGWAHQKFNAQVYIYVNSVRLAESTNIVIDKTPFYNFVFPTYTDLNSNLSTAQTTESLATTSINNLLDVDVTDIDSNQISDQVSNVYNLLEKFLSQLYSSARYINGVLVSLPQLIYELYQNTGRIDNEGNTVYESFSPSMTVNVTSGQVQLHREMDKYDDVRIDIMGVLVKNIGDLTHIELEDNFEDINSGLPTGLSQVAHSNLVKTGIFCELIWPDEMENYVTNRQIKYIIPRTRDWYDKLNSTIDYSKEKFAETINLSLPYALTVAYVSGNNKMYVGGPGGILAFDFDNLNVIELSISNEPDSTIKKILFYNNILYAMTEENIYKSLDFGVTWSGIDRTGLGNDLYTMAILNNNFVVGCGDGVYAKTNNETTWRNTINSNGPVEVMISPDRLFVVVDNNIYYTSDTLNFFQIDYSVDAYFSGVTPHPSYAVPSDITIKEMAKHRGVVYVATNNGLYTDAGSFYGNAPILRLVDLCDNLQDSVNLSINAVGEDINRLVVGLSDGSYYILENNQFTYYPYSGLQTIQKILVENDVIWFFGQDMAKREFVETPFKLAIAAPV